MLNYKFQIAIGTTFFGVLPNMANGGCFDPPRFPRYLQQTGTETNHRWRAIETSVSMDALFVGGWAKEDSGLVYQPSGSTVPDYYPVIARIDANRHFYKWVMNYYVEVNDEFQMVTAMAIAADDDTKMAVACSKKEGGWNGNPQTFIFVVDTATGSHIGHGMTYTHSDSDRYDVIVLPNQGILMDGGKIYTTFFATKTDFDWSN